MMVSIMVVAAVGFGILGAILASFVGVVSERVHTGQSWKKGRSRCNSCRHVLHGKDLLPVLSWVFSKGRCRHCGSSVPARYALFELAMGALFAGAYMVLGFGVPLMLFLITLVVLGYIVLYDLRHMLVPVDGMIIFLLLSAVFAAFASPTLDAFMVRSLIATGVALFTYALHALSGGRAMGLGDTPIAFGLALLVGGPDAISGLLFSFWIGALVGVGILLTRAPGKRRGIAVPFVPFLVAGYLVAFFTTWNPLPF